MRRSSRTHLRPPRTRCRGRSGSSAPGTAVQPGPRSTPGGPTTGGLVPPWMSIDPDTSRIWFATTLPSLCGARISWSDDDGDHWQTNPSVGCPAQGGEKLLEGPPPPSGPSPAGYPHVVYYCANTIDIARQQPVVLQVARRWPELRLHWRFPRSDAAGGLHRRITRPGPASPGPTGCSTSRPSSAEPWASRSVTTRARAGNSARSSAPGSRTSTPRGPPPTPTATSTSRGEAQAPSPT